MILIDAITPDVFTSLLQYGVLGIFSIIMIMIIRYQDKTNKEQQKILIDTFTKQNDELRDENKALEDNARNLNDKFLDHLQESESKLLKIVNDNTTAFGQIAESNDSMTDAIRSLIEHISFNKK